MTVEIKARRILIIGGGFSGMTAALEFARAGDAVEIVEIDPDWRSYGAGISLHGATLRVMQRIGIYDAYLAVGAVTDGVDMRSPLDDRVVLSMPTPNVGPGLAGGGAVMRPVLAGLLRDAVRKTGIPVRLGESFRSIEDGPDVVRVTFSDGSVGGYDLVVGADGLYSATRRAVFPEAPTPRFIGQAVWRAVVALPAGIERPTMWISGKLKAGLNLVSRDEAYLFVTENRPSNAFVDPGTFVSALRELLTAFPSPILSQVREELGDHSQIVYRPLEQLLLPRPWYRGRVVLIGDAVHATTPHLAAGACIGVEDAVVLAESLAKTPDLQKALGMFEARRWERCRRVVEDSGRLGEIEINGGDQREHAQIMTSALHALVEPI